MLWSNQLNFKWIFSLTAGSSSCIRPKQLQCLQWWMFAIMRGKILTASWKIKRNNFCKQRRGEACDTVRGEGRQRDTSSYQRRARDGEKSLLCKTAVPPSALSYSPQLLWWGGGGWWGWWVELSSVQTVPSVRHRSGHPESPWLPGALWLPSTPICTD